MESDFHYLPKEKSTTKANAAKVKRDILAVCAVRMDVFSELGDIWGIALFYTIPFLALVSRLVYVQHAQTDIYDPVSLKLDLKNNSSLPGKEITQSFVIAMFGMELSIFEFVTAIDLTVTSLNKRY